MTSDVVRPVFLSNRNGLLLTSVVIAAILGAAANVSAQDSFTVVALPDTQVYSKDYPGIFDSQTTWIRDNVAARNIVFVTHEGDLVDNVTQTAEWQNADTSMSYLDGHVPYGTCPGNHDYEDIQAGTADTYVSYFGPSRYTGYSWYGGVSSNSLNSYQLFSGGGQQFLSLHLQKNVPDEYSGTSYILEYPAIEWARSVLDAHPGIPTIVTTHEYLDPDIPGRSTGSVSGNNGEAQWQKLIKEERQIFMVLCGHFDGEYHQTSVNDFGLDVHEIMADYQHEENGGNGYLRLMEFDLENDQILVKTYSPYLSQYQTDADSQFTLSFDYDSYVPEPSALALLAAAAWILGCRRR